MSMSIPQQGVSETLINKKIKYSTEHITEMTKTITRQKDKNNRRNNYDLILGMEESNKDTTKKQDKTTPTMW